MINYTMQYTVVYYIDNNRECGTIYYGVTSENEAIEKYKKEFPQNANRELFTKVYK